jgi:hypothetical protein
MDFSVILDWVLARLAERSTWVGAVTLLASTGMSLDPNQAALIVSVGGALAGAIMVFTKDHNAAEALMEAMKDFGAAKAGEDDVKTAVIAAEADAATKKAAKVETAQEAAAAAAAAMFPKK